MRDRDRSASRYEMEYRLCGALVLSGDTLMTVGGRSRARSRFREGRGFPHSAVTIPGQSLRAYPTPPEEPNADPSNGRCAGLGAHPSA
jgi:hypothetical protein